MPPSPRDPDGLSGPPRIPSELVCPPGALVSEPALPAELTELDFQPEPASENEVDAEEAAGTDSEDHVSVPSRWRATLHATFRGTCQGKGVAVPKALEQMLETGKP